MKHPIKPRQNKRISDTLSKAVFLDLMACYQTKSEALAEYLKQQSIRFEITPAEDYPTLPQNHVFQSLAKTALALGCEPLPS